MTGFDLTNIQPKRSGEVHFQNSQQRVSPHLRPQAPKIEPQRAPDTPETIEDALFGPIRAKLKDENGTTWSDRRPEDFKDSHWSIDKFAEGPENLPVDQHGNRLLKAPIATEEDRKELNHE